MSRLKFQCHCLPGFLAFVISLGSGCVNTDYNPQLVQDVNEDGIFLYQKGDFYHARESFELALEKKKDDPGLLYNLAQCYDRLGDNDKAEKTYRLCLEHQPDHPECRHALTTLLYRLGRRSEAEKHIEGWLVSQPDSADAYVEDAWRLQQEGDVLKAQGRLQQALAKDPNNVRALSHLGALYETQDRPELALPLYEKALSINPNRYDLQQHINGMLARGVRRPLPD